MEYVNPVGKADFRDNSVVLGEKEPPQQTTKTKIQRKAL